MTADQFEGFIDDAALIGPLAGWIAIAILDRNGLGCPLLILDKSLKYPFGGDLKFGRNDRLESLNLALNLNFPQHPFGLRVGGFFAVASPLRGGGAVRIDDVLFAKSQLLWI